MSSGRNRTRVAAIVSKNLRGAGRPAGRMPLLSKMSTGEPMFRSPRSRIVPPLDEPLRWRSGWVGEVVAGEVEVKGGGAKRDRSRVRQSSRDLLDEPPATAARSRRRVALAEGDGTPGVESNGLC